MEKTTRRNLLKAAAVGGVAATGFGAMAGSNKTVALASTQSGEGKRGNDDEHDHGDDRQKPLSGRGAHATVAFGLWDATEALPATAPGTPLDRNIIGSPPNFSSSPNNRNVHKVLPFESEIEVGGAVSFLISGAHQILIYDDGTTFEDVLKEADTDGDGIVEAPPPPATPESVVKPIPPGLVEAPTNRIYRGLNPLLLFYAPVVDPNVTPAPAAVSPPVRDRVEVVHFHRPGRFLVVCGVVPHFNERMYGFVKVKKREHD